MEIFKGEIFDFIASPVGVDKFEDFGRFFPFGGLVVDQGLVVDLGEFEDMVKKYPAASITDYGHRLIMPGFIDTHIHYPQTEMIASYGKQLIDWLEHYTYPTEENFNSQEYAHQTAKLFLNELLLNGTTTCMAYATVHAHSVDALFSEAEELNMRIIAGKVMMERNAPLDLLDTPERSYLESKALIQKWHKRGRALYALTPRFAITCSKNELENVGKLHSEFPDTYIQTHISENINEISYTMELFPENKDYLDIYEEAKMVNSRTFLGHGIHLSEDELARIKEAKAIITHCPTSNLFLGSGLFNMKRANELGIEVTIATDVGAGTSFSLLQTLNEAYKIQQLQGYSMNSFESFYRITLGAATALQLDHRLGSFNIGNEADFVVLDYKTPLLMQKRMEHLKRSAQWNLESLLFGLMILGDDRNVFAVHLLGKEVKNSVKKIV